jgi:hypothetical protein
MGNGNATDARGSILVRTEKPYYFSGETVTGNLKTLNSYFRIMLSGLSWRRISWSID